LGAEVYYDYINETFETSSELVIPKHGDGLIRVRMILALWYWILSNICKCWVVLGTGQYFSDIQYQYCPMSSKCPSAALCLPPTADDKNVNQCRSNIV